MEELIGLSVELCPSNCAAEAAVGDRRLETEGLDGDDCERERYGRGWGRLVSSSDVTGVRGS
jgi:hypothetical protein